MGVGAASIAAVLGVVLAWATARAEFPGRVLLTRLLALPYALPAYLIAMAWVVLGNPTVGLLREGLPAEGVYGEWGMAAVLGLATFAFPYQELRAAFGRIDPALEEAARVAGAGPLKVFAWISLPLVWPAWLNGICLSLLESVSAFGVPAVLGLPVRKPVLTTLIYSELKVGGAQGLERGLRLSMGLLMFAVVLLGVSYGLTALGRKRLGATTSGRVSRWSRTTLGPGLWLPVMAIGWSVVLLGVALPFWALLASAMAPVAGDFALSHWTTRNLTYVLGLADLHQGALNSLVLATGVAALLAGIGFLSAYARVRLRSRWAGGVQEVLSVPFGMPGTVIALVLIVTLGGVASPWVLLAIAYSLKYAALGLRALTEAFRQAPGVLEEAAHVSGANRRQILWRIWLPLMRPAMGAVLLLVFLPVATELTMSVLLTGPGAATLGTVLFDLKEYADQPSAAAMAWMLMVLALVWALLSRKSSEVQ